MTNYVIRTTSNQGFVNYINGVGYTVNNPFYTCPANTYAKVIVKLYNSGGDLYIGIAPTNTVANDGIIGNYWGIKIDFGNSNTPASTMTTHFVGNSGSGGYNAIGSSHLEVYLMPGEKLMRGSSTGTLSTGIVFQVIEYAIP